MLLSSHHLPETFGFRVRPTAAIEAERFVEELTQVQEERQAIQFQRRNRVMNSVGRELGFKRPDNMVEQFGFEFTDEFLDTRLAAYTYGGMEAVKQLDRSWRAQRARLRADAQ